MKYLHVSWHHSFLDEPRDLYIEIDKQGWEIRKVEIFSGGKVGYACLSNSTNSTKLSSKPVPSIEEIGCDKQFNPKEISKTVFEKIWSSANEI